MLIKTSRHDYVGGIHLRVGKYVPRAELAGEFPFLERVDSQIELVFLTGSVATKLKDRQ